MKRFEFRLEPVLRIRAFELERARVRIFALEAQRERGELRLREARARIERGERRLRAELAEGVDGRRLGLRAMGLAMGRFEEAQAELALEQLRPELEAARLRLRQTRSRVRSLEKLKERRVLAHRERMQRLEQAQLDELAIVRAGQRGLGPDGLASKGEWIP